MNTGLVSMLGYENEHQIFNLEIAATWVEVAHRDQLLDTLREKKIVNGFETRWKRKDGSVFWVSLTATGQVDRSGNLVYIEVVALDIDEKKRAEEDLKRLQNQLHDMIDSKTAELKRANDLLLREVAERQKAESIYAVLHAIAEETVRTDSLRNLLEFIHNELSRIIHTPNLYFAFYNRHNETYSFPYSIDREDGVESFISMESMRGSLTEHVRLTGKPLLVAHDDYNKMVEKGVVRAIGSPSEQWMGVPSGTPRGMGGSCGPELRDEECILKLRPRPVLRSGGQHFNGNRQIPCRAEQKANRIPLQHRCGQPGPGSGHVRPMDKILFANRAFPE